MEYGLFEYWEKMIELQKQINEKKKEYWLLRKQDELKQYDDKIREIKNVKETCKVEFGFH